MLMSDGEWGVKQALIVAIVGGFLFPLAIILILPHTNAEEKEYIA